MDDKILSKEDNSILMFNGFLASLIGQKVIYFYCIDFSGVRYGTNFNNIYFYKLTKIKKYRSYGRLNKNKIAIIC